MATQTVTMPTPKKNQPARDDVAVKVDRKTVGKARLVATHRGVSVAELLSELLVGPVDQVYAEMVRDLDLHQGK